MTATSIPQRPVDQGFRVVWASEDQISTKSPLRGGTYDECLAFMRDNWSRLMGGRMAQHGWSLDLVHKSGRRCSWVLKSVK